MQKKDGRWRGYSSGGDGDKDDIVVDDADVVDDVIIDDYD